MRNVGSPLRGHSDLYEMSRYVKIIFPFPFSIIHYFSAAPGFKWGGAKRRSMIAREAASDLIITLSRYGWAMPTPFSRRDRTFGPHVPRFTSICCSHAIRRAYLFFRQMGTGSPVPDRITIILCCPRQPLIFMDIRCKKRTVTLRGDYNK